MVARISLAIVSCNAAPDRREMIPISRARRVSIVSCNARPLSAAARLRVNRKAANCWRPERRTLFQYCGCRLRHSLTRSISIQPSAGFPLPAPLRHFFCVARRLARTQARREQKCCLFPGLGSTANGCPQCAHSREGFELCAFCFFIVFLFEKREFSGRHGRSPHLWPHTDPKSDQVVCLKRTPLRLLP